MLLVIGQLGLGGTEQQLVLLADGLQRQGIEIQVASLFAGGTRETELADAGIPCWIGNTAPSLNPWRFVTALLGFLRLVRRFRPDVVHTFLFHAYVTAGPIARLSRVPVVVAGRRSLGVFLEGRPFARCISRLTLPAYDAFIANSHAVADDAIRREGLEPAKVFVVPNALSDGAPLSGRDRERPWSEPPVAICVGNLIPYKGHRILIDSIAQLREDGVRLKLLLVGDGPERGYLEHVVAQLALDVDFLGMRRDVSDLLAHADIFVLPSLEEGMSNALMEAMAAGLPIVVTDVGGNREAAADTTWICSAGSAKDLAEALAQALNDEQGSKDRGRRAQERAGELFSVSTMVRKHIDIYGKLASRQTRNGQA